MTNELSTGDEFEFGPARDKAALVGLAEKAADALAAGFAVIKRPVVDVHADEFIGKVEAHIASELEGVGDGFGTMIEAVANALGEEAGDSLAVGG